MSKLVIQQGDVLFYRDSIPETAKEVQSDGRGFLLREGEATGHAHVAEETVGTSLWDSGGELFLRSDVGTTVRHDEHHQVSIPPGTWRIGVVREIDPYSQEIRNVQD